MRIIWGIIENIIEQDSIFLQQKQFGLFFNDYVDIPKEYYFIRQVIFRFSQQRYLNFKQLYRNQ